MDWCELLRSDLAGSARVGVGASEENEVLKEALDNDVCPSITAVLRVVGVVGADGWVDEVGTGGEDKDMDIGARGVVGVVASFGYSLSPSPTLTD